MNQLSISCCRWCSLFLADQVWTVTWYRCKFTATPRTHRAQMWRNSTSRWSSLFVWSMKMRSSHNACHGTSPLGALSNTVELLFSISTNLNYLKLVLVSWCLLWLIWLTDRRRVLAGAGRSRGVLHNPTKPTSSVGATTSPRLRSSPTKGLPGSADKELSVSSYLKPPARNSMFVWPALTLVSAEEISSGHPRRLAANFCCYLINLEYFLICGCLLDVCVSLIITLVNIS